MTCPTCAHENRPGAKFCEECAGPLKRLCASCGVELRPTAKFCDECGASVVVKPIEAAGARKVVTIVFADLVGSTALHERLDAESARRFVERYYEAMRAAIEAHGGTVAKLLGDGVMAVFGVPRVAEDDAIRAVRAAVAMQDAFRALAEQQRGAVGTTGLRVAVNTGEVVAKDETELIGDPVNVAARLQDQGRDGDVVIGEATRQLVATLVTLAPLGRVTLKGRAEAVRAYRVVSLERPASATTAAFVGRDDELARLMAVYDAVVARPAARLAVLLGSPGLGKSRLMDELTHRLRDVATVLTAQCEAAGGATFAPLAKALRERLGIDDGMSGAALRSALADAVPGDDAERARILDGVAALLAGSPAAPEETFFVVRRLLAALATVRPVVLLIDDLQWAEPLLLDLIEHLVQWGNGVRLVVLVGARPELRDARSSLATPGALVAEVMTLAGLDAGAAMRLAANVIGAIDLPAAVAAKVLATSEGNPLFVSELVRMLVHEGALARDGERWTIGAGLAALEMPPTIQALLASRIERLRPEERMVLERAAVVGRHFSRSAVAALVPREVTDLDARLEALRRSELIEPDSGWFLGEPALRFHHVLIRDVAYRRLLKGTRAELHARFADWIEARVPGAVEHDETLGWHLEQAHQHLRELGPIDEQGRMLGERAARHLAAAGRRALARDDLAIAASLLGRALDRLDADDPARADVALDWCEALLAAGDVGLAAMALAELGRFSAGSDRLRAWHVCFTGEMTVLTAPQELHATADAVAAAADDLAALDDAAGEAKGHHVHAQALARLGRVGACETALDHALAAARRAGDRRRANAVLVGAPRAALWGPSPVTRASGRCLDVVRVLRITQGAPAVEAIALSCQGVLEALRGRTAAARRMIASSRQMVEELGITHRLYDADVFAARIELLEGDAGAAERLLRAAYEGLRDLGLGIDAAQAAALLARALLAQDRAAEAEALSHESEVLAGDDLQAAIAWRGVRAEALARRGEHVAAVEFAETAVAIAAATDALLDHADARLALAAALRAAGRNNEADGEERRATELWEAKGATLLAERERRDGGRSEPVARMPADRIETAPPGRRPVRANAATANAARLVAAAAARDLDVLADLFAAEVEAVHHPTATSYGREGLLTLAGQLIGARDLEFGHAPLATLGESLALSRETMSFSALDDDAFGPFGAVERERVVLIEVDGSGRQQRTEFFAADRLSDAIVRLYERYAELLPDGPARTRAATTARSVAALHDRSVPALRDPDGYAAVLSPLVEFFDHRSVVSVGSGRGVDEMLRVVGGLSELVDDITMRCDDVLGLESGAVLLRVMVSGTAHGGGGAIEIPFLMLAVFDSAGLVGRYETFDPEPAAAAFARFDALVGSPAAASAPAAPRFPNAATRASDAIRASFLARDWEHFAQLFSAGFRYQDRRRIAHLELDREGYVAFTRQVGDLRSTGAEAELLATRGDRLELERFRLEVADHDIGPSEIEFVSVVATDDRGAVVALVRFDADDLDAAYAELDARYDTGEAASPAGAPAWFPVFARIMASRDWEALADLLAPTLVAYDHRLVSWGTLHGPAGYIPALRSLVELAPDVRVRIDHLRTSGGGEIVEGAWLGTRDGGDFEIPVVAVVELDEQRRNCRLDLYDLHQLDQARARFDALAASAIPDPPRIPPNAATRSRVRCGEALAARDWVAVRALVSADFSFEDRGRRALVRGDVETMIASMQFSAELPGFRVANAFIGTFGDRIELAHIVWTGGPDSGAIEIPHIRLHEVDADGQVRAVILFDPDDRTAAFVEGVERFAGGEAAAAGRHAPLSVFFGAFLRHDWEEARQALAPELVFVDHRTLGLGRLDRDQWVASFRALAELSPDLAADASQVLAVNRHGLVIAMRLFGTVPDGGPFENPLVAVVLIAGDRLQHYEAFNLADAERAVARFEQLCAAMTP